MEIVVTRRTVFGWGRHHLTVDPAFCRVNKPQFIGTARKVLEDMADDAAYASMRQNCATKFFIKVAGSFEPVDLKVIEVLGDTDIGSPWRTQKTFTIEKTEGIWGFWW